MMREVKCFRIDVGEVFWVQACTPKSALAELKRHMLEDMEMHSDEWPSNPTCKELSAAEIGEVSIEDPYGVLSLDQVMRNEKEVPCVVGGSVW